MGNQYTVRWILYNVAWIVTYTKVCSFVHITLYNKIHLKVWMLRSILRALKRSSLNWIVDQQPLRQKTETALGQRVAVEVSLVKISAVRTERPTKGGWGGKDEHEFNKPCTPIMESGCFWNVDIFVESNWHVCWSSFAQTRNKENTCSFKHALNARLWMWVALTHMYTVHMYTHQHPKRESPTWNACISNRK